MFISLQVKRKQFLSQKWKPGIFVDFRPPYLCPMLAHQHGTPIYSSIILRETFREITKKRCPAQTWDLEMYIVYLWVFCNISFPWLLSFNGFKGIFYCATVKTLFKILQLKKQWRMISRFSSWRRWRTQRTEENQNSKKVHRPGLKFPNTFTCLWNETAGRSVLKVRRWNP